MSDKNIRMAILDDGVHPEACPLAGSFLVGDDLSVSVLEEHTVSPFSHGSMCARIVQRYVGLEGVDVFSIQILQGDTQRGNIGRLLKAFALCITMDIRLIHLSVGTYAFEDFARLEEAVHCLLESDRFLIAAAGNRGIVTYPAYLPGVIGVKCHPQLTDDEYTYFYDSLTRIYFQASSKHQVAIEGMEMETPISNSYAAPLVTAKILFHLKNNAVLDRNQIWHLLTENARNQPPVRDSELCPCPPVEIPVVLLSGFSAGQLSHLIKVLMECLRRDDYHTRAATNLPGIRPWEETALPESEDLDLFIARMAWYFSCEIILVGIVSYIPPDRYGNVSLWIYGEESDELRTAAAEADGQVLWAGGMKAGKVYEVMVDMLS